MARDIVYDYSLPKPPSVASLKQQNAFGVIRCLPREERNPCHYGVLTPDEYDKLTNAGIEIGLIGRSLDPYRTLQGYPAGMHDAEWYSEQARQLNLNFTNIYACYDFHKIGVHDVNRALDYAKGWHRVLGHKAGAYGYMDLLHFITINNYAHRYWLCGKEPVPYPTWINLYQWNLSSRSIDGINCGINWVIKKDWGQCHTTNIIPLISETH